MKGIELFGDILMLIMLIAMVVLLNLLIWTLITLQHYTGLSSVRNIELNIHTTPSTLSSSFLAFLELNYNGIPMKKILTAVAVQQNTNIWIDGQQIDATDVSKRFLDSMFSQPYMLKINNPEIIIAKSGTLSSQFFKTSTKIFTLDGAALDLQLFVD